MAGLAVIIICLTLALIWMWKRMEKMKQEIYTFTDRLEECLDAMASGEEIKNPGNCEDSLWDKVYERLRRIENIWSRREEESVAEKKQIKELISDISHQTKTPIANIKIYLELLDNEEENTEKQREYLEKIEGQTEKLDFLLKSMVPLDGDCFLHSGYGCEPPLRRGSRRHPRPLCQGHLHRCPRRGQG